MGTHDICEISLRFWRRTLSVRGFGEAPISDWLQLDQVDMATDPLEWWGTQDHFAMIHRVVKMLFQIPASSAENERSFSSASFILSERRTRLDLDNFRREHRIRRAICAGSTPQQRLQRSNALMERFAQVLLDREANAAQ